MHLLEQEHADHLVSAHPLAPGIITPAVREILVSHACDVGVSREQLRDRVEFPCVRMGTKDRPE